ATLSYEEIKAAATGNPLLVDHAKTKAELARLERLQRGYQRNLRQLRWTITNSRQDIGIAQATIAEADAAIIRRRNTRGNAFTMTIRATTYAKRGEANDRLKTVLGLILADPRNGDGHPTDVGELGGFTITATVEGLARGHGAVDGLRVRLRDVPGAELRIGDEDLTGGDLVTRLENRLGKLEILRDEAVADIGRREAEIVRAEHDLTRPFRHQDQLSEARAHFQHLDAQVTALATASEAEANTGADDTDDTDEPAESEETIALGDAGHGEGGMSPAPGRTIGGTDTFRRSPTPTEASTARSAADASPEPVLEPATSMDASAAAMSPEQRLMRRAAARVPQDSVLWPSVDGDHPAVRLDSVANGTYGQVTGVDLDRQPITVAGYVMQARALSGGIGGWSRSPVMVVKLGDLPDGPVVHTVQTDPDARLTVRDPPEATMPAGEDAPWLRMSVEEQILSARSVLGLGIEVLDGPHHELWQVEGCPHQLTGEVASWLFDGRYGSWDGRARPAFRPERLDEAFVAGRIQPDRQRPPAVASWNDRIQITVGRSTIVTGTTGNPKEAGLRGLLKQHRFRYHRSDGQWRYTGRREDRHAAIGDIQRWLDAQDRADEAKAEAYPRVPQFPPTEQQQAIIDAYLAGKSIAVQALAGTGKTATLLMLANARPDARIAYIAFNRSIADEAQRKFGRNVRAETSHAFAREGLVGTPIQAKLARVGQGARWSEEWARHLGITAVAGEPPVEPETMARMAMACVRSFRESAAETITAAHLPQHVVEGQPGLAGRVLDHAKAAWRDITDPAGHLLFDHDDYLKIWALGHPRLSYDVVFFDEAQDINDVLREVIQQQPQQTIVVGDSNQSIYGFRGAIDALKRWPADLTLPLTQSWRFGPAVAEAGNQFLALLHSPLLLSGNPTLRSSIGIVEQPDAILARTNAGAVSAVFASFDNDRRVALMGGGRAIEEIAKAAKDLQAGRGTQHPDLARFSDWEEARAYVEEGEDAQSLRAFVRLVDRRGADGLLQMVTELVNEDETDLDGNPAYDVIVSTVHKAKGREWAQLRIAEDFPQPQENLATRQVVLPNDEQLRLAYVAVTRARQRLELGSLSWIGDVAATADRTAGLEPQPTALADEASDTCDAAVQAERQAAARLARLDTASGIPVGPTTPRNAHGSRAASVAVGTADSAAHWFNRAPRC
ncbi:MAG: AAA family ATPase, partial [Dactylosporangium sp.]|nr:AAA family ATPase [Dactylosporangium sp.]NNJ63509.1 AAA family ATPase [Dactylosporangium sp.]